MAEVLEPPGAAPVKTWKVCISALTQARNGGHDDIPQDICM
jgi:hypothetical protein